MDTLHFLAQLWGFSLVIVSLSLLVNSQKVKKLLQLIEGENASFLHGVIRVVLGVAMVLTYNVWDTSWKVMITLLGWLLLASGIALLFVPSLISKMIARLKATDLPLIILTFLVLLGCVLIYFGFVA